MEVGQDGDGEAVDVVLGGLVGHGFFEDFGDELEGGEAESVDGGGEGRPEDFELVESHEVLSGTLGVVGADLGGGL